MTGRPYSKAEQLSRSPAGISLPKHRGTHRGRVTASPERWRQIVKAKTGECRCAGLGGCEGRIELHHVRSRAQGGSDTESNVAPLCSFHHARVTRRHPATCKAFLAALTDAEYALALEAGEDFFERAYGLSYERV